uniref:Uncharacterized protein n=1 Tax=Rhizophora mucronata TaxID=61149 RepID=A0A2P2PST2_RHIMU
MKINKWVSLIRSNQMQLLKKGEKIQSLIYTNISNL